MKIFILLAHQPSGGRHKIGIGAPWVNVQAAATGIAGINAQLFGLAETLYVIEDAFPHCSWNSW